MLRLIILIAGVGFIIFSFSKHYISNDIKSYISKDNVTTDGPNKVRVTEVGLDANSEIIEKVRAIMEKQERKIYYTTLYIGMSLLFLLIPLSLLKRQKSKEK
jgi:hypothetical protein